MPHITSWRFVFSPSVSCCLPQLLQASSNPVPQAPPEATCFSALLQTAYESQTLWDERVQAQLQAAIPHLAQHQVLRSAKQVLLCLRTTVENFGQVSAVFPALLLPAFYLCFPYREYGLGAGPHFGTGFLMDQGHRASL